MSDLIDRQAAIEAIKELCEHYTPTKSVDHPHMNFVIEELQKLPSVQLDRDIPMKPIETTDRAWGILKKQAVCPKCDYYLGNVSFLGDYKGKRITYCETCGQAIDWEGWDFDD